MATDPSPFRAALYSTLNFIGRHVRGFWPALATFFALGIAVGAAVTGVLVAIAGSIETGPLRRADELVLRWFEARRGPLIDSLMLQVTTLGDGIVVLMIVIVASVFLWLSGHRWSVYVLLLAVAGGQLVNNLLKLAFGRPRPDAVEWLGHASTQSFPSGHAMSAILTYGSVAYLAGRLGPRPALRHVIGLAAALLVIAIGVSRVHLGVHYPSDVIGGYIAGGVWLVFVAASVSALRFFAPRRPSTRSEERGLDAA
jgi:undecaprenyl-diphosphatase